MIQCVPNHLDLFKTDERDETREPGAVLWRVHRATERLSGHAVLQERQSEGQRHIHCCIRYRYFLLHHCGTATLKCLFVTCTCMKKPNVARRTAGKFPFPSMSFFFHNHSQNVLYTLVLTFFNLQDVLKAADVDLDGMFKLSFAYDIVNVSQVIHATFSNDWH